MSLVHAGVAPMANSSSRTQIRAAIPAKTKTDPLRSAKLTEMVKIVKKMLKDDAKAWPNQPEKRRKILVHSRWSAMFPAIEAVSNSTPRKFYGLSYLHSIRDFP